MASVTLKPDPQRFPVGTVLKVFAKPPTPYDESGKPPGAEVTCGTVEATSPQTSVTFSGLTEGASYVAWSSSSGPLKFLVRTAVAGAGISKADAEALIAELAVSSVSPAFTGTPIAPTAAEGTNNTQLANTKYADRAVSVEATARASADTTEKGARETADALALAKASNLSDLASAGTARTNLGLGTAATQATGAFDAAGVAATAQAAAELASGLHLKEHAVVNTNATTGTVNAMHPVDDTAESRPIKLPTGAAEGSRIGFEKTSAELHEVSVEGSIRGEAAQTIKLRLQRQTILFVADSAGSWWPIAMYVPLATLTTDYVLRTVAVPAGVAPGNELLAEWKIKLHGTEKRTIVSARIRTVSGTITVAIARGEAGATEIAAYKALKGASTEELVESEQALSDKDRITVTSSAGSTPKGLFLDIWEKVEK